MAAQVFAYIEYKNGVADDTALELISAAQKIYPDGSAIAIVTGSGADLDGVCNELSASYSEVWKFDSEALAYPNAEAIRKLLVAVLPAEAVVLVPHDTFGMDLAPGQGPYRTYHAGQAQRLLPAKQLPATFEWLRHWDRPGLRCQISTPPNRRRTIRCKLHPDQHRTL